MTKNVWRFVASVNCLLPNVMTGLGVYFIGWAVLFQGGWVPGGIGAFLLYGAAVEYSSVRKQAKFDIEHPMTKEERQKAVEEVSAALFPRPLKQFTIWGFVAVMALSIAIPAITIYAFFGWLAISSFWAYDARTKFLAKSGQIQNRGVER